MDTNDQIEDDEIIRLIQIGDSNGFASLYKKYRKEFLQWVSKVTKCGDDDAKEYYQGTVLIVYENIHTGKLEVLKSTLKTYLFAVGKNLISQQTRVRLRTEKIKADNLIQMTLEEDNNTQDKIVEEPNHEMVSLCLAQLGDPCYSLLDLFYFSEKNMDEIAVKLNYKNGDSAKNQKYKCMERLRKLVEVALEKETVQ